MEEPLDRRIEAINRFPDANPHPVMRLGNDGVLRYANPASTSILAAIGARVGERLPEPMLGRIQAAAATAERDTIELEHEHRTWSLLAVAVADFDFINVYGTDITAQRAVDKFPGQNPNPVLRIDGEGRLIYANGASQGIVDALGLRHGEPLPDALLGDIRGSLAAGRRSAVELQAGDAVYELLPVEVPEFGFVNLYGTDVTAARRLADALALNERLLLNILPRPIADRLLAGERVIADRFEDVTLLFADIVDFTGLSTRMSANEVVEFLNEVFSLSDRLADEFGLEKIKTVGDAYMVVGGMPDVTPDHTERVADMALALATELRRIEREAGEPLICRMGIHRGPAVAGVIGTKKFIYDVWGDTVNTASRMESHGVPDRIQVTAPVRERLADRYLFEERGLIDIKGKGLMPTWFLLGRA